MSRTVLDAEAIVMKKIEKIPALVAFIFQWSVRSNKQEINKIISDIHGYCEENNTE